MNWIEQFQSIGAKPAMLCALGSYAIGCFATGYYLVRSRTGRDIREIESGSIGARNVGRVLGKSGFVITTMGDFSKGALAVAATRYFTANDLLAMLALVFVVIGHIWPATLNWRGGKGVITSLGALVAFDYRLALVFAACFAIGYGLIRKSTLPAMLAYLVLPAIQFWMNRSPIESGALAGLAGMILFAHRQNLAKELPVWMTRRGMAGKTQHTKP